MITSQLDEQLILNTLRQVVDPEIDCNIVDLGLIYGTHIEGSKVTVHAHGQDASQALTELETLINRKFDEE